MILSRYDGKTVRVTTADGSVYTGAAETFLRALFPSENTMIDVEPGYTEMAVICQSAPMMRLIRQFVTAEGFFLLPPDEQKPEHK